MMRGMGILWCIRVSMMHSMKNCIGSWGEVGATLPYPSEEIEEFFPKLAHHKHLVSSITMKEETLAKQGEIPVK